MRQITSTGQVTVTTAATRIKQVNVPAAGLIIKNAGAVNVYVGNADVTAATGHLIEPHDAVTIPVQTAVYGITVSSSCLVTFCEIQ